MKKRQSRAPTTKRVSIVDAQRSGHESERRLPDEETLRFHLFDGNGPRFVQLFGDVWGVIPTKARQQLIEYWRQCPAGGRIELIDYWSGLTPDRMAQVDLAMGQIRFRAGYMDAASDADVQFTIAHELAHVLQLAGGRSMFDLRPDPGTEPDADTRALGWLGLDHPPRKTRALCKLIFDARVDEVRGEQARVRGIAADPVRADPHDLRKIDRRNHAGKAKDAKVVNS